MDLAVLSRTLRAAESADGGWPYFAHHHPRLEPTCWALLAGVDRDGASTVPARPHAAFLERRQTRAALLADDPRQPANLAFNGLAAVLALDRAGVLPAERTASLLDALTNLQGIAITRGPEFRQDSTLRGWPWSQDTFSWVEPTSWCLLALKKMRARDRSANRAVRARIEEAERLLIDRCCRDGGWNFGNSAVLGQDLRPYAATTAIALLALQDRRVDDAVVKSVTYLQAHAHEQTSGLSLALSLICFHVFGLPTQALEGRLDDQWRAQQFFGNLHVTALALYALDFGQHRASAFTL